MWIHGDLHPGNLLVDAGELTAVLDFGDVTAGDPATDLSVMWMLFPSDVRGDLFAASGRDRSNADDEQLWRRAHGWALSIGVAVVALGRDGNPLAELGKKTIAAALAGGPD
jgi:aminoglycoside phosphotransferase (APT) family kinase protein